MIMDFHREIQDVASDLQIEFLNRGGDIMDSLTFRTCDLAIRFVRIFVTSAPISFQVII